MTKTFLILLAMFFFIGRSFAQEGFTISGIMQHSDLEGGCWYLESKNMKYELTGSPELMAACRVVGRMLTLRVRERKMMASTCMLGHIVEVLEVLDTVHHPHNPPFYEKKIKGVIRQTKNGCWYVLARKKRYELQGAIPTKFMHGGAKYNRVSVILPASESKCDLDAVITISHLDRDMKQKGRAREKKADPR